MRKSIATLLTLALCLGLLAGCGRGAEDDAQAAQTEELGEQVYVPSFQTLHTGKDSRPQAWLPGTDGVYAASYERLADGELPEGRTADYAGQYDRYGYKLRFADGSGQWRDLAFEDLTPPSDSEGRKDYSAGVSMVGLYDGAEGELLALERLYESWRTDTEAAEDAADYFGSFDSAEQLILRRLDPEGGELSRTELDPDGPAGAELLYAEYGAADAQGRLYLPGDGGIHVFDTDGKVLALIPVSGWVYSMARMRDGRMAAVLYDAGMSVNVVDPETGSLGESWALEGYLDHLYPGGGDYDFYYSYGTGLYGYRLEDERAEKLLDWLDCDMTSDGVQCLSAAEDGSLQAVWWDWADEDSEPELVTLQREARSAVAEKETLTLGTLYTYDVSRAVLKFNRSHDDVRIRVRDYSEYVSGDDYEEGLLRLTTEMMAGDMPDLLAMDSLPYAQMAARGLLEDLYPFIDADSELKREDFFENVLAGAEVDGGFYEAAPGFSVITLMGPASIVGDKPGWTYDDFYKALEKMPEGCTALGPYVDRDQVLQMCLFLDMDSFVDWGAGTCDFDSEGFVRLLEFAGSFPREVNYESDGVENDQSRIAEGRQMLLTTSIYSIDDLCYNEQIFGGDATYIGYPTENGTGNILYLADGYAMSSSCADKQAAWDFLRVFLTESYESSESMYALPLNKAAFQKKLDKAMEVEYEKDEDGNEILDANGEKIPAAKFQMGMSSGEDGVMTLTLYAVTQEQADKLMEVINGASKTINMDLSIYNIVREEAAAFFAGQKSAEDVAHLVQSKVNLYISEQR